ncbi:putative methyltransferase DDB_G0268948 isoform X1 [Tachyglossus aculeatus]|uniref:putative methyltransferase DDB_G0268948 isoform X1 n=1 Tax=Tachyglossus aculeatus TaxID=9261 RepID=UPI0018F71F61|nr:putative methyltransferase DDB_G0268948 isoform X1 [Tachyglossus aculeatus]XP_038605675.1 putative methyltransferase DDB_G0268948 isoform X1 [Tachyglossus aculeatus]XP_038605676.1 putative methyltransferase DDB_G0268948 isoform X1 [Tachyglossus aculeatus]
MSVQLFEGEDHAALYQKYRFPPSAEVLDLIFSFLGEKKQKPYKLAVDVGCGSGQSTRVLAPHFERVLGTDISEAQIQQAGKAPSPHNVSYRVCPAEELPLEDASVDLVTAFTAAHWFDTERFLQEVTRVLKPQGCVALSTYLPRMSLQFGDRSDQLTQIFREVQDFLSRYASEKVNLVHSEYQEIFDLLPFPDKKRIPTISSRVSFSVAHLMGFIQSFSMFQTFLEADPEAAEEFLKATQERFLQTMGVSSLETPLQITCSHVCVLACKTPAAGAASRV